MNLSEKQVWEKIIEFIQEEAKVNGKINLVEKSLLFGKSSQFEKSKDSSPIFDEHMTNLEKDSRECVLCGKTDHAVIIDHIGRQVVQYFSCKMFNDMTPRERFKLLFDKGLCYQCLSPGASSDSGKHRTFLCFSKFICRHQAHSRSRYPKKKYMYCCEDHKHDAENVNIFEKYRNEKILCLKSHLPDFSQNIKLFFHCHIQKIVHESYLGKVR